MVKVVYRYDFHENDNDHQKGLTSAGVSASYGQKGISIELLLTPKMDAWQTKWDKGKLVIHARTGLKDPQILRIIGSTFTY